jgi:L-asparaginase
MTIKILATGGTFDKEYNPLDGSLFFKDSHVPEVLRLGRSMLSIELETVTMMDSLQMTDQDRKAICQSCRKAEADRIVITHGTDTMVETAQYLAKRIKDKTIVLTGAMVPFVFGSSDGLFNLGSALAFAQVLPHGVYLAMNGRYFTVDNVRKNKSTGVFEALG